MRSTSREELERCGRLRRRLLLAAIFSAMPRRVHSRARRRTIVVDWWIGESDGPMAYYQLVVADGRARCVRRPRRRAAVSIQLEFAPFLKLVSGAASGPELLLAGDLKIDGDPLVASRLPRLFRLPARGAN